MEHSSVVTDRNVGSWGVIRSIDWIFDPARQNEITCSKPGTSQAPFGLSSTPNPLISNVCGKPRTNRKRQIWWCCTLHAAQFFILAYYAWPRTSSTKVTRKEIRDVSTFTAQHVRAATRSIKCERQWRHVALATAGPMLLTNNMAAYPLRISNSVCPLRISNTCLMSVHTIYNHVKSIICYLCFMQHAWSC